MKALDITRGMQVKAEDGAVVGLVTDVWAYVPHHGYLSASGYLFPDYGTVPGTAHLFNTSDGYISIQLKPSTDMPAATQVLVPLAEVVTRHGEADIVLYGTAEGIETRFETAPTKTYLTR